MKTTAETVKQALVDAETAQLKARKAIDGARADIKETETRLAQVTKAVGCDPTIPDNNHHYQFRRFISFFMEGEIFL